MKPIIVDTGPLYALADQDDGWHERVFAYLSSISAPMIVPVTVLPEVCYLLGTHLGAYAAVQFVHSVLDGEIQVEFLKKDDLRLNDLGCREIRQRKIKLSLKRTRALANGLFQGSSRSCGAVLLAGDRLQAIELINLERPRCC